MDRNIIKAFLSLAFLCLPILGTQHMVCKTMDDVFDTNEGSLGIQTRQLQGPPGKRGVPGIRGPQGVQGPRGTPAIVDYQKISEIIEQKIRREMGTIRSELDELEGSLTPLNQSSNLICVALGGMPYASKCYFVPYLSTSQNLNYNQAVEKCRNENALVAEIRTQSIQEVLQDFVRLKMKIATSFLWIGMTYQSSSDNLQFRRGDTMAASKLLWRSGYPSGVGRFIYIKVNSARSDEGLRNRGDSDWDSHGVICERNI